MVTAIPVPICQSGPGGAGVRGRWPARLDQVQALGQPVAGRCDVVRLAAERDQRVAGPDHVAAAELDGSMPSLRASSSSADSTAKTIWLQPVAAEGAGRDGVGVDGQASTRLFGQRYRLIDSPHAWNSTPAGVVAVGAGVGHVLH